MFPFHQQQDGRNYEESRSIIGTSMTGNDSHREQQQQQLDEQAEEQASIVRKENNDEYRRQQIEDLIQNHILKQLGSFTHGWIFFASLVLLAIVIAAIVITVVLVLNGNQRKETTTNNQQNADDGLDVLGGFLERPSDNLLPPPVARCKRNVIYVSSQWRCAVPTVDPKLFDDGSHDPKGEPVSFSLSPSGPYQVGAHTILLVVIDSRGRTSSCGAAMSVVDDGPGWVKYKNHAYRVRKCRKNYTDAVTENRRTNYCGLQAHLATVTTVGERLFLRSQKWPDVLFLGGTLTLARGLNETESGWRWGYGEGPVRDGVLEWHVGKPYNPQRRCLAILSHIVGHVFNERPCSEKNRYLEEVDLENTVMINGCDSGVKEQFLDPNSCTYLIGPQIEKCATVSKNESFFGECVDTVLDGLVADQSISLQEKSKIKYCRDAEQQNRPPIAQCKDVVALSVGAACRREIFVTPSQFDDGSMDPDGDEIQLLLFSEGPFETGKHTVTLTVYDSYGQSDSCQSTLVVTDDVLSSGWSVFGGSIYRLRLCRQNWPTASLLASRTKVCGKEGQLATIQSMGENRFLFEQFGRFNWLGGFQPRGSEPGSWIWFNNDEGIAFTGARFRSRDDIAIGLGCLFMTNDGLWNSMICQSRLQFIEEINLVGTVVVGSCDSGVRDIAQINSCKGVIEEGLEKCNAGSNNSSTGVLTESCVDNFLEAMVQNKTITVAEKSAIQYCGQRNVPPIARCKERVKISTFDCQAPMTLSASQLDDGSIGDGLQFRIRPSRPLPIGIHSVSLIVSDRSGATDECNVQVIVMDFIVPISPPFSIFGNHAYRVRFCGASYENAKALSSFSTPLCNTGGHLATISSLKEGDFVLNLASTTDAFIARDELTSNITLLDAALFSEDDGSLNGTTETTENCLLTSGDTFSLSSCHRIRPYIEEFDLDMNISFMDCDSGIPDLPDISSCVGVYTQRLSNCVSNEQPMFSCLNATLLDLIQNGIIDTRDGESILDCAKKYATNKAPMALCKASVSLVASLPAGCSATSPLNITDVNNGSFDPDGDELSFSLSIGDNALLPIGKHQIVMTVQDDKGGIDTCESSVLIMPNDATTASEWLSFGDHAYRFRSCETDWHTAAKMAENTIHCGQHGHLVTISTEEERLFVRELGVGDTWLGAFQPKGSQEPAGGWTWVNGEGLVSMGLVNDWDYSEPNHFDVNDESCMVLLTETRNLEWADRSCLKHRHSYLEEFDLSKTVVLDDCDSGVLDMLVDPKTCGYMIKDTISTRCPASSTTQKPSRFCVETVLGALVENGMITRGEAQSIASCARG